MASQNPYETPTDDLNRENDDGVGEISFFSPRCRIGRLRLLAHFFLWALVIYPLVLPGVFLVFSFPNLGTILIIAGFIAAAALLGITFVQRLHDVNLSAWWLLLFLVLGVNFLFALYLLLWPGTEGKNNFGLRPPPNKTWHWVLACFWFASIAITIVSAFALPAYDNFKQGVNVPAYQEFE